MFTTIAWWTLITPTHIMPRTPADIFHHFFVNVREKVNSNSKSFHDENCCCRKKSTFSLISIIFDLQICLSHFNTPFLHPFASRYAVRHSFRDDCERYQFSWSDKATTTTKSRRHSRETISICTKFIIARTLAPVRSVNSFSAVQSVETERASSSKGIWKSKISSIKVFFSLLRPTCECS